MKMFKKYAVIVLILILAVQMALPSFAEEPQVENQLSNVFQIFLSGIDARGEMTDESRTDANIVATVNMNTKQVLLVHVPRDYYLDFPDGTKDKLSINGLKGIRSVLWCVGNLFKYDIPYYARINFNGFVEVIDAMGGVDLESDYEFTTSLGGFHIDKGMNHLNGEQALGFVHERYAFNAGDRQRGRDQMILLEACINQLSSGSALENLPAFLEATNNFMETNIPFNVILQMLQAQGTEGQWNVVSTSVDGTDSSLGDSYVMEPNMESVEAARTLMQRVMDGEILDQDTDAPNLIEGEGAIDFGTKEMIMKVQTALNNAGFDCGTPDGVAGPQTKKAIREYQEANGLTVSGDINMELARSLGLV